MNTLYRRKQETVRAFKFNEKEPMDLFNILALNAETYEVVICKIHGGTINALRLTQICDDEVDYIFDGEWVVIKNSKVIIYDNDVFLKEYEPTSDITSEFLNDFKKDLQRFIKTINED